MLSGSPLPEWKPTAFSPTEQTHYSGIQRSQISYQIVTTIRITNPVTSDTPGKNTWYLLLPKQHHLWPVKS